jgi:hypothetical protein
MRQRRATFLMGAIAAWAPASQSATVGSRLAAIGSE